MTSEQPVSYFSVSFSPDSARIVSGSDDNIVRVWDANTAEVVHTLAGHTEGVRSVSWDPTHGSNRIVSGSDDNTVRVWVLNDESWALVHTLEGHEGDVNSVSFSPDSTRIVSGSNDNTVRVWVWNDESWAPLDPLAGHGAWVMSVSFSPNGERIVSGSLDKTVRVWDAVSGQCMKTLEGHTSGVMSVSFSPYYNTRIVSGSLDETVRVWNAASENAASKNAASENLIRKYDVGACVNSVSFSPDGTSIACGLSNNYVGVFHVHNPKAYGLQFHKDDVKSVSFSPNGLLLASGSSDGTIKRWILSKYLPVQPNSKFPLIAIPEGSLTQKIVLRL